MTIRHSKSTPPPAAPQTVSDPGPPAADALRAHRILKRVFGFDAFRPPQQAIIECLAAGDDVFVLMPTGSGKSICYQIPAMLRTGVGIVISPLIALMQDQVAGLRASGVRAAFLNSSLTPADAARIETQTRQGDFDLLYVAPERLLTGGFQQLLQSVPLALFAIDEAHCVSQWGHDFRPEYLQIAQVTNGFPGVPRIALTATADAQTREDILRRLNMPAARRFVASFDRPNIRYRVQPKRRDKQQLLAFIRGEHPGEAGIVYVRTRKRADALSVWLEQEGVAARAYHAGLSSEVRAAHHMAFVRGEGLVMVATIAFGMGIDKPDVRFVAHLDLPASMEAYYQETGRAGRDGAPADAWMVYTLADVAAMRHMLGRSEGSADHKRIQARKLQALLSYGETVECRRRVLLGYFDEDYAAPCGNCDNCLAPVATWDGTVAAQKALSCVYRTGQRFGAVHLIDVLQGRDTAAVRRWGHQRIKTFGAGAELDRAQWQSVYRQLLAAGLLAVDLSARSGFRLTAASWPVLRGERPVRLRRDPAGRPKTPPAKKAAAAVPPLSAPDDQDLWERLRTLRREIAQEGGLPPYAVFHDKTLREMVQRRPADDEAFLSIGGVGQTKAARYGARFLAAIKGPAAHGKPEDEQPG